MSGEVYSDAKIRALAVEALEGNRAVEDVVSDEAERAAIAVVDSFAEETQDDTYGGIPFETVAVDRPVTPREPRPAPEPRVEGPGPVS